MVMAMTDFTMIKAGSLHRANGGYLVIDALALMKNLFSYDSLKRALKGKEIRIEDVWEQYRLITTTTLRPEPIPLNVKVILTGTPFLYYILYNYDDEYRELFKVKADFDTRMPRNEENIKNMLSLFVYVRQKKSFFLFINQLLQELLNMAQDLLIIRKSFPPSSAVLQTL